jgi:hypothetical protein
MSDTQFTNVQRRIMNLYENGHKMETDQLQRAIDGLIGSATHMVKLRKSETITQTVNKNDKKHNY